MSLTILGFIGILVFGFGFAMKLIDYLSSTEEYSKFKEFVELVMMWFYGIMLIISVGLMFSPPL